MGRVLRVRGERFVSLSSFLTEFKRCIGVNVLLTDVLVCESHCVDIWSPQIWCRIGQQPSRGWEIELKDIGNRPECQSVLYQRFVTALVTEFNRKCRKATRISCRQLHLKQEWNINCKVLWRVGVSCMSPRPPQFESHLKPSCSHSLKLVFVPVS